MLGSEQNSGLVCAFIERKSTKNRQLPSGLVMRNIVEVHYWRIGFKLVTLTFKALQTADTGRPPYLSDLLQHEPTRSLSLIQRQC